MRNIYMAVVIVIIFSVISVLCPGMAAAVSDGDDETAADAAMANREMGGSVRGLVMRVDHASGNLVVRDASDPTRMVTVTADGDTTYFGTDSIKTINPGDSVSIDCTANGDSYIADNVTVESSAVEDEPLPIIQKVISD